MSAWRSVLLGVATPALAGCGRSAPPPEQASAPSDQEPPVALDPDSPVQYPPTLYDQNVEGDVVLRMFVDSTGRLVAESSKVAESSGNAALDTAALAGAKRLHFAPARRHGLPVATAFLQPVEFRRRGVGSGGGGGGAGVAGGRGIVGKARPDTSRTKRQITRRPPAPDTTLPSVDTGRAARDTSRPRPDTSGAKRDTSRAKPDTNAAKP